MLYKLLLSMSLNSLFFLSLQGTQPIYKKNNQPVIVIDYTQKPVSDQEKELFMNFFAYEEEDLTDLTRTANLCTTEKVTDKKAYQDFHEILLRAYCIDPEDESQISKNYTIGLAVIKKANMTTHVLELEYLCVDQSHQKKGAGKALLEAIINRYAPERIEVNPYPDAISFYKENGFKNHRGRNTFQKKCST